MPQPQDPPRDHHIVPRFYLEGFCKTLTGRRQPTLWVYEKGRLIRPSTAAHEARERDFYTIRRGEQADYRFEHFLSWIEGVVAPILQKLDDHRYFFSPNERSEIGLFAALMHARVRSYREFVDQSFGKEMGQIARQHAEDRGKFESDVRAFEAQTGRSMNVESLRTLILSEHFQMRPSESFNLAMVLNAAKQIAPLLLGKAWHIVRPDRQLLFVTSDNPISTVLLDDRGRAYLGTGFGRLGVQVIFPLRSDVCLVMDDAAEDSIDLVGQGGMQNYNEATMRFSHRNMFAAKKSSNLDGVFQRIGCTVIYGENAFLSRKTSQV